MKSVSAKFFCFFLFLLTLSSPISIQAKKNAVTTPKPTIYFLNGVEVKTAEFDTFSKSLKEVKDTYQCKKTTYGGTTVYEAIDQTGVRYTVRLEDGQKVSTASITKSEPFQTE